MKGVYGLPFLLINRFRTMFLNSVEVIVWLMEKVKEAPGKEILLDF